MHKTAATVIAVFVLCAMPAAAQTMHPVAAATLAAEIDSRTREVNLIDQSEAERLFSESDMAVWFPELRRVRWLDRGAYARDAATAGAEAAIFGEQMERDYPRFRSNAFGRFLIKMPLSDDAAPSSIASALVTPTATVFTDSFENGLSNWTLDDNTLELYAWGTSTCEARTGARSADALRGGVNTLTCTSTYAPDIRTEMLHKGCEGIAGASTAWVDAWIHVDTETNNDSLGFFYADAAGDRWGYGFSGTWTAWFHVVLNLKQWYRVGDVTATSCPALSLLFRSNGSVENGLGARVDDITIGNATPSFLACSIAATPTTGVAPLAVNFTGTATGGSASTTYSWTFGDAASTTSTSRTPSFTYTTAGDYWVRLRVEDQGVRAYAHILVRAGSATPCTLACNASAPSTGQPGAPVAFQANAIPSNCNGTPAYSWTFGDGQSSAQQNPQHTYPVRGTYSWTMNATLGGVSCSRSGAITIGDSTTTPKRRAAGGGARGETTLAKATIGPAGGTLSGGGLTLTVPGGAFSSNTTLTLSRTSAAKREGDAGDRFMLRGMPAHIQRDLTLDVELPASTPALAPGAQYYLSVGAPAYVKSVPAEKAEATRPFRLVPTVSGKKLSATISTRWGAIGTAATVSSSRISPYDATTQYETEIQAEQLVIVQTQHFYATVPSSQSSNTRALLDLFEPHEQNLFSLGFSLDCRIDSKTQQYRKIEIVPKGLGTVLGSHVSKSDPCGTGWFFNDYIEITTSYPATDPDVNWAAGHELFHLVQDIYSPGGPRANLWLKEASSIWYELTMGNPCPSVQAAYQVFPWTGLFNSKNSAAEAYWTTDREARHGYGASYFLWHHSRSDTDPFVRIIWDLVRGGSSEVAAVQGAMGSTRLADDWREFAKDYFYGRISGACPISWAGGSVAFDRVKIADEQALPASIRIPMYPLSARSWAIDLQKFNSSGALPALLSATGLNDNQSAYVYDVKAKAEVKELTRANPEYSITDVNSLSGNILVVVLVDRNLPASGDINAQKSSNDVDLSLTSSSVGVRVVFKRENGGPGDVTPTLHGEWFIDAPGARVDPTKLALVLVSSKTINIKGRVMFKAPFPDFKGCANDECVEFRFLGFTGKEELWVYRSQATAPLVTAPSAGGWLEAKNYTMPRSVYTGTEYEDFGIRVFYDASYKKWKQSTGEVLSDWTGTDYRTVDVSVERQ